MGRRIRGIPHRRHRSAFSAGPAPHPKRLFRTGEWWVSNAAGAWLAPRFYEVCHPALACLLTACLLPPAAAAAAINGAEDLLRGRWYAAEVIIFEYANATDELDAGPEDLTRFGDRSYPANLRAMAEGEPWAVVELDPLTRTCLEFPRLEVALSQSASQPSYAVATEATDFIEPQRPLDVPIPPSEETAREPPAIHPVLSPHPLLDLLSAAARSERALLESSYRWLAEDSLQLRAEARRIRRASDLQVIWHGRWMQPAPPRDAGEPLLLQVGSGSDGLHPLEGTLQITLGRYLHFWAQLWWPAAASAPPRTFPYIELNESRAMRSGELHYLDHPKIGVLVRIDPVPVPVQLAEALETWQQSEADG